MDKKMGNYAFIVGVVLAVVLGLAGTLLGAAESWLLSIMVLLGLVVGFMNVSSKKCNDFLLTATALVIVVSMGTIGGNISSIEYVGVYLAAILSQIMAFIIPATIVVGLKQIWEMAK